MTKANFKKLAKGLACLSDENRIQIICFLQRGERCVCEIWQELNLPQNLVSHHLKVLRDNQLIKSRKDGLKVYYTVERDNLERAINSIKSLFINKRKGTL